MNAVYQLHAPRNNKRKRKKNDETFDFTEVKRNVVIKTTFGFNILSLYL